nr:E5 DELTA protein [human papillomavirus 91]WBM84075.1 E5 DELTA protein [human papillomavirus 91]
MLTCQFDDGDSWMLLWLLVTFITVLLMLLVFHYRTVKLLPSSK